MGTAARDATVGMPYSNCLFIFVAQGDHTGSALLNAFRMNRSLIDIYIYIYVTL